MVGGLDWAGLCGLAWLGGIDIGKHLPINRTESVDGNVLTESFGQFSLKPDFESGAGGWAGLAGLAGLGGAGQGWAGLGWWAGLCWPGRFERFYRIEQFFRTIRLSYHDLLYFVVDSSWKS